MENDLESPFQPNWVSPPSETMKDIMEEKNISIDQFIDRMKISEELALDILESKIKITLEIALKLSNTLGSTHGFWITRDQQYWKDAKRLGKYK